MMQRSGVGSHGQLGTLEKCRVIGSENWQDGFMEMIGHRGASHDAPENTLAAIRLAWEQGADAVEVDVHLSRDGQIVVVHDANTRRTGRAAQECRNPDCC